MADEMETLFSELFEAAGAGRRHGERIASLADQTQARWQTLWTIDSMPLTVPQIGRRLGVSRQNIQRLVNELEAESLVELSDNPDHRTSPLTALTPAGRQALAEINASARQSNEHIKDELGNESVAALRSLLRRFTAIVKEEEIAPRNGAH